MEIKFGIPLAIESFRASIFVSIIFNSTIFLYASFQKTIDDAYESVLRSRTPNLTLSTVDLLCGIPYEDCLCSIQSTKHEQLKNCLTHYYLLGSPIYLQALLILQIFTIRELFSVNGKYSRILVWVLWIISVFIFVFITNGIYRDNCFYYNVNTFLHGTGILLFLGVAFDIFFLGGGRRFSHNNHNTLNDSIEVEIYDDPIEVEIDDGLTEVETDDDSSEVEIDHDPIVWRNLL